MALTTARSIVIHAASTLQPLTSHSFTPPHPLCTPSHVSSGLPQEGMCKSPIALKDAIARESFEVKGKFPPALKPKLQQLCCRRSCLTSTTRTTSHRCCSCFRTAGSQLRCVRCGRHVFQGLTWVVVETHQVACVHGAPPAAEHKAGGAAGGAQGARGSGVRAGQGRVGPQRSELECVVQSGYRLCH